MIPLVLLDVDGTLVGASGIVEDCVWEAVDKVNAAGMKLALCTGRACDGVAQRIAERIGPTVPHIFQSGALLAYADGTVLKVNALKESNTRKLINHARDLGLVLELYTPSTLYVERKTAISDAHAKMLGVTAIVRDLHDVSANEPVIRAQWVIPFDALPLVSTIELTSVQLSVATSPALKDTYFASVTQEGTSKGTAARDLAQHLKVNLKNVMGVGDSASDLPMLEVVGHPVVMANAEEPLKEQFRVQVGDVEDCGVVEALMQALETKLV